MSGLTFWWPSGRTRGKGKGTGAGTGSAMAWLALPHRKYNTYVHRSDGKTSSRLEPSRWPFLNITLLRHATPRPASRSNLRVAPVSPRLASPSPSVTPMHARPRRDVPACVLASRRLLAHGEDVSSDWPLDFGEATRGYAFVQVAARGGLWKSARSEARRVFRLRPGVGPTNCEVRQAAV